MSGKNFNGGCCFDYGNSETNDRDDGAGAMEAIYFGNAHWRGNSGGSGGDPEGGGPWVGADLESGMYYGGGNVTVINNQSQPLPYDFVSLTLKGRTDGFMMKGGDATQGKQTTMFDGPRPFETAGSSSRSSSSSSVGARSGDAGAPVSLQKCTAGNHAQTWQFENDRKSIGNNGRCLDISNYQTAKGSTIVAFPCGHHSRDNEFWELEEPGGLIQSLQAKTPFCLGTNNSATTAGATTALDSCTAASSAFTVGFTNTSGTGGTVVQKTSGLCLTMADVSHAHLGRYICQLTLCLFSS